MPTRDLSHSIVRRALEKDGWRITDDPLHLHMDDDLIVYQPVMEVIEQWVK
jgi:hypothetical protein